MAKAPYTAYSPFANSKEALIMEDPKDEFRCPCEKMTWTDIALRLLSVAVLMTGAMLIHEATN